MDATEGIDASEHASLHAELAAQNVQGANLAEIGANPLRDEPTPGTIRAVKWFGLVGLIACALGAAWQRWWRSGSL